MTVPVGSVCTGYGGLDLAIEAVLPDAGLRWCADYEPPTAKIPRPVQGPARVIARRFPGVPNLGDITAVRWPDTEHVEVVAGGTPCQDVSVSGAGAGMRAGTRSGIWSSMVEAIRHHRPALVVWENVGGALSAGADSNMEPCPVCVGDERDSHLRALGRVVGDLAEIGYDAVWTVVSAADVDATHRRERVWVFAWPATDPRGKARVGGPGLREGEPASVGWGRPGNGAGSDAADPQSDPRGQLDGDNDASTDPARDGRREGRAESARVERRHDAAERGPAAAADADRERWEPVVSGVRTGEPDAPRSSDRDWGDFGPAVRRWESVLGRPAPAPTAPNSRGGQALSPAFVEWMMGLPAGWVTDPDLWHGLTPAAARNAQLKLLGNGVVPQQAEAALRWGLALAPEWVPARLGYTLAS